MSSWFCQIGHLIDNILKESMTWTKAKLRQKIVVCFLSAISHWTVDNRVFSVYFGSGLLALTTDVLGNGRPGE